LHCWDHKYVLSYLAYWLRWVLANIFLGWPWTVVLLISTSHIAGITDNSHYAHLDF
jgi:hypothetical protein